MTEMNKTERIMEYGRDGKPKPGGRLVARRNRVVVGIEFCPKCGKTKKVCKCR